MAFIVLSSQWTFRPINASKYNDICKIPKTPSKSEIFSVIVDWSIFSYTCIHLSGPQHPLKVKYFSVIVDWSIFDMYSPSKTTTPSQLGLRGARWLSPASLICNKTWFETKMLTSNQINSILSFFPGLWSWGLWMVKHFV